MSRPNLRSLDSDDWDEMDGLSQLVEAAEAQAKLGAFVTQYRDWIDRQRRPILTAPARPQPAFPIQPFRGLHPRASLRRQRIPS